MKCNMCGREVDEKESFCLYCGSKLKKINNNIISKKEKKKEEVKKDDDEKDNTLVFAGIVSLFLLPVFIFSIIMFNYYIEKSSNSSSYMFGPVPDVSIGIFFLFLAIITILIPIIIVITGSLTGVFRENKKK